MEEVNVTDEKCSYCGLITNELTHVGPMDFKGLYLCLRCLSKYGATTAKDRGDHESDS